MDQISDGPVWEVEACSCTSGNLMTKYFNRGPNGGDR